MKSILEKLLWAETTTNHADRCSEFSSWVQGGVFLKEKVKCRYTEGGDEFTSHEYKAKLQIS